MLRDFSSCLEKKSTELKVASFLIYSVFCRDNTFEAMWILFSFHKDCFTLYTALPLPEAIKVTAAAPAPSQQFASSASIKKSKSKYSIYHMFSSVKFYTYYFLLFLYTRVLYWRS